MSLAVEAPPGAKGDTTIPEPPAPELGSIGPYRLLTVLGEGGMGTVYLAEQREPIHRRVALKVVRAGVAGKEVLARFEAERQALALMTHPGIARVLDAGTTADGAPFFAMEYVHGEPITDYCDRKRLSTDDRLALFRAACAAVQHAHQRGILHRDLKPSNLLVEEVDGEPKPKVIDFGLAKALNQRLTERTLFTERGAIVGTPEYMSPEQAAGEAFDVDTTTDVYSLGVILYELLTGSLPHDPQRLREAGWLGMMKILREEEAKKPSTKVSTFNEETASTVATKRKTEPKALLRSLRGDLDWILLKALDKERERRYSNVSDLAADLELHLTSRPVTASPPSAWYRTNKFVRRHRLAVLAASFLALSLVASLVLAMRQVALARRQRAQAQTRLEAERLVTDFQTDLYERLSKRGPENDPGWRSQQAVDVVAGLEQRLASRSSGVQALALTSAASALYDQDLKEAAGVLLRRAFPLQENAADVPKLALATTLQLLALVDQEGKDSLDQLTRSYELYREELGFYHPVTVETFCQLALRRLISSWPKGTLESAKSADNPGAEKAFQADAQRCVDLTADLGPESRRLLARRLTNLGIPLSLSSDGETGRTQVEHAVALLRSLGPEARWQLAESLQVLAFLHAGFKGDSNLAVVLYREACSIREETGAPDSSELAYCRLNLGAVLMNHGVEREAGMALRKRAVDALSRQFGAGSPKIKEIRVDEPTYYFELPGEDPAREDLRRAFARARDVERSPSS